MLQTKKLFIIGAGGHGVEAAWIAEAMNYTSTNGKVWDIAGFVDDNINLHGTTIFDYPLVGTIDAFLQEYKFPGFFYCALGNNKVRARVSARFEKYGWLPAILIHPSAIIARNVNIRGGAFVGANALIEPFVEIGNHVLINAFALVAHHVEIGDYAQLCPGAKINGSCKVGKFSLIGSNASLHPGICVGDDVVVGANSFVISNVADGKKVLGVPASKLKL